MTAAFPDPWLRRFSVKANDVPAVIAAVAARGFGANVVSAGEWANSTTAGLPNAAITLEGIGKTDADLRAAVRASADGRPLAWLAVESVDELAVIDRSARRAGLGDGGRPPLDVLLRLNPAVAPETSSGLAVGRAGSKFGMDETELTGAAEAFGGSSAIRLRGIHLHVGSQLGAVDAWRDGVRRALAVAALLRGNLPAFDTLDVGGGFPVGEPGVIVPSPERFARELPALLEAIPADRRPTRLAIEPGRALVARAGWLVASVLHVRARGDRQVVLDAGMTELVRPALYGARHPIVALTSMGRSWPTAVGPEDAVSCRHDGRRADLRIDRFARHPRPATAAAGRHRRHRRRRGLRRIAIVDVQRPAPPAPGPRVAGWQVRPRAPTGHRPLAVVGLPHVDRSTSRPRVHRPARWALVLLAPAVAAGPPFPDPVAGQNVYDTSGIWSEETETQAEGIIDAIEARTGVQVVAYSQDVGYDVDLQTAREQAAALGHQWGVGRGGFDDGLVLLFDIDPSGEHGQVVFVGGDGFRNTYLSDDDTTRIFDDEMLHYLRESPPDFDAALIAGLEAVDAAVTPDRAAWLERARIFNAILGLIVAPLLAVALVGWALFNWLRFGRDPVYLDDPSILMPAPPDTLTAATGALVYDGKTSRRALTTALLDLASRGSIAFEDEPKLIGRKVAVVTKPDPPHDEVAATRQRLAARRPISGAEQYALQELRSLGAGTDHGLVDGDELLKFGPKVSEFDKTLEAYAVSEGWFRDAPSRVRTRWFGLVTLEVIAGFAAIGAAAAFSISGLTIVGAGLLVAAVVTIPIAAAMPARTMPGAVIRAMLAAYRRTLQKTMEQARSMDAVVAGAGQAGLTWIETPDQALVWSVALGLQGDVDEVLRRSVDDLEHGRAQPGTVYTPLWFGAPGSGGSGGGVGWWRLGLLRLGDPKSRRHGRGTRRGRQLAVVEWLGQQRRVRRWRRLQRGRRRLLLRASSAASRRLASLLARAHRRVCRGVRVLARRAHPRSGRGVRVLARRARSAGPWGVAAGAAVAG